MKDLRGEVCRLIARHAGRIPGPYEAHDLVGVMGVDGDDMSELLADYAETFGVAMDGFLRYFHYRDEPPISRRLVAEDPAG